MNTAVSDPVAPSPPSCEDVPAPYPNQSRQVPREPSESASASRRRAHFRRAVRVRDLPEIEAGQLLVGWEPRPTQMAIGFAAKLLPPAIGPMPMPVFASDDESHQMIIGPTGSGKGVSCLIPTLLTYPGSCIVVDIKGEAAAVTANYRKKLGQKVVILDPFDATDAKKKGSFNPLDLHSTLGAPVEDLAMELPQLLHGQKGLATATKSSTNDEFWEVRADGLIAGILAHLLTVQAAAGVERNLVALREIIMADDATYSLAKIMDTFGKTMPVIASRQIASFLSTVEVTRSGILATAIDRVSTLFHPGVEHALRSTSFDLAALRDGCPMSIYLVIPPTKLLSHGRLLRIWVSSFLSLILTRTRRPKLPTLLLIDEAAHAASPDHLRTALTLLRGFGVRTMTFWQDISQLKRFAPDWETLLNNCMVRVFGCNTLLAARAAADLVGSEFSAEMILKLAQNQQLIVDHGKGRCIGKLDYRSDVLFKGRAGSNPLFQELPLRKKRSWSTAAKGDQVIAR